MSMIVTPIAVVDMDQLYSAVDRVAAVSAADVRIVIAVITHGIRIECATVEAASELIRALLNEHTRAGATRMTLYPHTTPDGETDRLRLCCNTCGKPVSTPFYPVKTDTPDGGLIVRAFVQCPECMEKRPIATAAEASA